MPGSPFDLPHETDAGGERPLDALRGERDWRGDRGDQPWTGAIERFDKPGEERGLHDLRWESTNAPLGTEMLSSDDIRQGEIGDCWALAPIGAVAHTDPEGLARRIQSDPTGERVRVILDHPHDLDRRLPEATADDGRTVELHADAHDVAWPAVVEKAIATEHPGGYRGLHHGGTLDDCAHVVSQLDGRPAQVESLASLSDREVLAAFDSGRPIVVGTRPLERPADGELFDRLELTDEHAYWGAGLDGDRVILGNPHGFEGPRLTVRELRAVAWDNAYVIGGPR